MTLLDQIQAAQAENGIYNNYDSGSNGWGVYNGKTYIFSPNANVPPEVVAKYPIASGQEFYNLTSPQAPGNSSGEGGLGAMLKDPDFWKGAAFIGGGAGLTGGFDGLFGGTSPTTVAGGVDVPWGVNPAPDISANLAGEDAFNGQMALQGMGQTYPQFLQSLPGAAAAGAAGGLGAGSILSGAGAAATAAGSGGGAMDQDGSKGVFDSSGNPLYNPNAGDLSGLASIAKSLGVAPDTLLKALGGAGGALLGSMNGAKPAGTTTTIQDIPDWLKPYAQTLIGQGQSMVNANTVTPGTFNTSDATINGIAGGSIANPHLGDSNPYFESTLTKALNDTQGRVNNQFRNSAFGGSANQELLARNLGDQANALRAGEYDKQTGLYEQDINRRLNASTAMPAYSAAKTTASFAPLTAQKGLLNFGGSQTSQPYFTNPTGGALYGGLLGSQLFGGGAPSGRTGGQNWAV